MSEHEAQLHRTFGDHTIWLAKVNGQPAKKITEGDESTGFTKVVWSPDGGRIAYLAIHQVSNASECALKNRDLQGGAEVEVTAGPNLCRNPEGFWWAPGGRLIFSLAEPAPNGNDSNLWEVKLDPRSGKPENKPARLTNWVAFSFASPTLTADVCAKTSTWGRSGLCSLRKLIFPKGRPSGRTSVVVNRFGFSL